MSIESELADARRRLTSSATVNGYRFGALAARMLPGPLTGGIASTIGLGASFASPARRHMIARHLRRVDPSLRGAALRHAVQQAFDYYARYYIESFRLPTMSRPAVAKGFSLDGFDQITDALELGNGVILALPHLGGWEWAGRWMTDQGFRMTVVVEALDPPELFDWFADLRKELGMTVVATGPNAGAAVLKALRDGETVCLLCDRDLDHTGVEVEFFGERTTLPPGPATLSLRTGAPLFPVGVFYTSAPSGHHAVVRPALPMERRGGLRDDVARITQDLAHELELLIRMAPTQWHLFQPNWPSDPGY